MTIEEAIKTIMSVGIVTPTTLPIELVGTKSQKESVENFKGMEYGSLKIEGGP
jgi:uncharacterized membrane protein